MWTGVLSRNIRPRPTELQCLVKLNVWAELVRAGYSFEGDSGLEMRKRAHRIIMGLFSEQWLVEDEMLWVDGCKTLPSRIIPNIYFEELFFPCCYFSVLRSSVKEVTKKEKGHKEFHHFGRRVVM